MDLSAHIAIKNTLENTFDIPFNVECEKGFSDSTYHIRPENDYKDLFDITIIFKNKIRIVIEVVPEKYAALSISEMSSADMSKKIKFAEYAKELALLKASPEFRINDSAYNPQAPDTWPEAWNNYKFRVTRSPIVSEDEKYNEVEIACEWALIVSGMFLSLLEIKQKEDVHLEGGLSRVEVNRYERDPINRQLCLIANGYVCRICGFDFEKTYGEIGYHFINVHHIVPISKSQEKYEIDPVIDLIPVCPNCHAMLHKSDPPYSPDELKKKLSEVKQKEFYKFKADN